ncbi:NTF2 fold immunity protein [Chromobacterium sp.]|uniref:NTF2 fold immunity protein n=1 Tax=Chromobacterium sp. TaxID=306190 RepID=UPI0035B009BE
MKKSSSVPRLQIMEHAELESAHTLRNSNTPHQPRHRRFPMSPIEFTSNFLTKMLEWEDWYYAEKKKIENMSSGSHIDAVCLESRAKLELILQPYLTETAFNTIGQAKLETLGVGRPRLYDQEAISCTEITPTKFETITISRKQQNRYSKYLIFLKKDNFKIDKALQSIDGVNWTKKNSI